MVLLGTLYMRSMGPHSSKFFCIKAVKKGGKIYLEQMCLAADRVLQSAHIHACDANEAATVEANNRRQETVMLSEHYFGKSCS